MSLPNDPDFRRAVIEATVRYGSDGKGKGGLEGFRERYPRKYDELVAAGIVPPPTVH